jgi:hypothetical protein
MRLGGRCIPEPGIPDTATISRLEPLTPWNFSGLSDQLIVTMAGTDLAVPHVFSTKRSTCSCMLEVVVMWILNAKKDLCFTEDLSS